MKILHFVLVAILAVSFSGCAKFLMSKVPEQSEAKMLDKAETATGIESSKLAVVADSVNITDDTVNYKIKTKKGQIYKCYYTVFNSWVPGSLSGESDAICTKIGGKDAGKSTGKCNELLRAAGKC